MKQPTSITSRRHIDINWHLNRNCNYNCRYCFLYNLKNRNDMYGHGIDIDIPAFKKIPYKINQLSMSGGEPFLYPDYVELCKKLTQFCNIYINTNCSTSNIYDFADKINPKKVNGIHISVHLDERRDHHDELIDKIHYLRRHGFHVPVTQVLYPPHIKEFKQLQDYYKHHNIWIYPKPFVGVYHFRHHPPEHIGWRNHLCDYGYNHFVIQYNGNIIRCHGDKTILGNLYTGDIQLYNQPNPCNVDICNCPSEGWRGTHKQLPNLFPKSKQDILKHYIKRIYIKIFGGYL